MKNSTQVIRASVGGCLLSAMLFAVPAAAQLGQINKGVSIAKKANEVRDLSMTDAEEQALGQQVSEKIRTRYGKGKMPRTLNLISGPSRSGDVEQKIILGAHGPRALHIIVVGG